MNHQGRPPERGHGGRALPTATSAVPGKATRVNQLPQPETAVAQRKAAGGAPATPDVAGTTAAVQAGPPKPAVELDSGAVVQHPGAPAGATSGGGKAGGAPLPDKVRSVMEATLGMDLSEVRAREGSEATALGALAYTQGNLITFAPGQYRPDSPAGQVLIGHELAHVVQQAEGRVPAPQTRGAAVNTDQSLEREADDAAARAARGEASEPRRAVDAGRRDTIQRQDDGELKVPFAIHFDKPISGEQFEQIADLQIHGVSPGPGRWMNVKPHYEPVDSPVHVWVAASLVKRSRSEQNAGMGFGVDKDGSLEGANERAEQLADMPGGGEKAALLAEIDRRYWEITGIPPGQKIRGSEEQGKIAIWNQVRDEVLASRAFITKLPQKVQYVMHQAKDGVAIVPRDYATVVRIAQKILALSNADLENYLRGAERTDDLKTLEAAIDRFTAAKTRAAETLRDVRDKSTGGDPDGDVDSEAAKLDKTTMFYLGLAERLQLIRQIADGTLVGDEDEETLIRLLATTPQGDQPAMIQGLKSDGGSLLKKLESVIDGAESKEYYAVLRTLVFGAMKPEDAQAKMFGAKEFPWADPGLIKAIYHVRFYYETVEYTEEGKLRVVYWVNLGPMGMKTTEQVLDPDEIICVRFFMDEDFANAKEGENLYMPAANLLAFKHEQFSREVSLVVDVGLLAAGGVGLAAKGTRLAKAIAVLDTTLAAASLAINSFRSDIAASDGGKTFLRAWDTVNTLIAVYGLARVVVKLPETFKNLRQAYTTFRAGADKIDPVNLKQLETEAEALFGKADAAAFENEVAGLRTKYTEKQMAALEKEIDAAGGITDPGQRTQALQDIESQAEAQKKNTELIERLKKDNPNKSTKEIADLAADELMVPNVPFGYTATEFKRAQTVIKDALAREGFTNVEGFATGSRVTGTTLNPKKAGAFGQAIEDFKSRDLDTTLITDRPMSTSQQNRIKAAFKSEFGHDLGIRNIVDRRQLDHIPMYGKIGLEL